MRRPRRRRDDRGSALVEFTWLGILLLIPLLWIILSVFEVQRGAFGVSGAARAAARAYALAPDDAAGSARGRAAARQVFLDQGVTDPPSLRFSCPTRGTDGTCHSAGAVVRVDVTTTVDLPFLPSVLGGGAPSFRVSGEHTVPYGTFRE